MGINGENHKVVQALENNWHTVVAVIMQKIGMTELQISVDDLIGMDANTTIVCQEINNVLLIKSMSTEEAQKLVAAEEMKYGKPN